MKKLKQLNNKPTYRISINKKHISGIGTIFIKWIYINQKPSFNNCDFYDITNGEWARYI